MCLCIVRVHVRVCAGPWEHMIMMGIGAYGMNYIGQYTIKAQEEYDANQDKQRRANAMRYT